MTAARFDMLKAIASSRDGLWQSELRGILGVSAQAVSRMLRVLEGLRWARRHHDPGCDWKRLWVSLTHRGRRRLRRTEKLFVDSGALTLGVDAALLEPERLGDWQASFDATEEVVTLLWRIRSGFHDRATLYDGFYPPW